MDKKKLNETLVLAYQNHQKNNLDIAQNLYEKILKEHPNHFETLFLLGTLLSVLKNYDKGKQMLQKASQINPKNAKVYNNLGTIHKELNEFEESISCYKKASQVDSSYTKARGNLIEAYELYAKALFKKNFHKKALDCIEKGPGLIRFSEKNFEII
tara:strand:- start:618 stop:1085 length:468 start_codon:yes stop_codon:yes gene_type:complete